MERNYNVEVLQAKMAMAIESLNDGQRATYNGVIDSYVAHHAKVIFINGPGGMGKTYTENLILNAVRSSGNIALVVTSLGIVTLLLSRMQRAHSYLKILITLDRTYHGSCVRRREYHHVWTLDVVLIDGFQLIVAKTKKPVYKSAILKIEVNNNGITNPHIFQKMEYLNRFP